MCSESLPKDFEKTTDVLPFTKYGLSSVEEFRKAEEELHHQEWLKKAGLTNEEIKLYRDNEAGLLDQRKKIESGILKDKLECIYNKINNLHNNSKSIQEQPSTSSAPEVLGRLQDKSSSFYPEGHPMNELKQIEGSLFGHLKTEMMPISKRCKILRRLQRKKERLLAQEKQIDIGIIPHTGKADRPDSLWDVKNLPKSKPSTSNEDNQRPIGPKQQTMYTIKDNKIVRLEPVQNEEYRAVDIVIPVNNAEVQLLEGTKMSMDDIKKIDRFKDYKPGVPSKILYLKNIEPSVTQEQLSLLFNQFLLANGGPVDLRLLSGRMRGQAFVSFQKILYLKNIEPSVTQEQLSLLFNQFLLANGGPVDLRLLSGRMRGQAFVSFQDEDLAIQALEEVNGTILSGRPIIAEFGRNTNRIQLDDHR